MAQHIDDESSYPLVMRDDGCAVISGKWLDPYDNKYYYSASDVQIDHVVALYESHISGSGNFTSSEQDFTQILEIRLKARYQKHLINF